MTQFTEQEKAAVYRVLRERRDMRHFLPDPVDPVILAHLLAATRLAPSVGLMQPWRFIRVTDVVLRKRIASLVSEERDATVTALGDRAAEFLRLKVEGIRECAELLVAVLAPDDGTVLGRCTLPEMDLAAVACAIQNLWLAARAENLGIGWVSIFDPTALARRLALPTGARPVAILCLRYVEAYYPVPMLEQEDWRQRRPWQEFVFHNTWANIEAPT